MSKKRFGLVCTIVFLLSISIVFGFVQSTDKDPTIVFEHLDSSNFPIDLKINDQGSDNLNFAQSRDALVSSMQSWIDISTSRVNFTNSTTSSSATGVNDGNFILAFDESSSLGSSVVAAAFLFINTITGEIVDSDIEFNGNNFNFNVDGTNGGGNFDLESVATHEIGHLLGLDHATIGTDIAGINTPEGIRPTMYPFIFSSGTEARSLEKDDATGASFIYPETTFYTNLGGIKGNITRNNGSSIFGANVVVINTSSEPIISSLSGYSTGSNGEGEYLIVGLDPGNYTIALEPLDGGNGVSESSLAGIFSGFDTSFSDEFYNNRPNFVDSINVSISAGQNITGINFVIGNVAPTVLNVTIDSTDDLNRTNGTLIGNFVFNDSDFSDVNVANETLWYNNSIEIVSLRNLTSVSSSNTTAGDNWTFSIRVFDGTDLSNFVNGTITIISNTSPTAENVAIISSDFLNRTNGTLVGNWTFSDLDGDTQQGNETIWYKNGIEDTPLGNLTVISSFNTTKNEIWNFSVRVFDGNNFSNFVNASITINNAAPEINITQDTITINETQQANITTNASDLDIDALTFTTNNSNFNLIDIYFIWNSNLSDSGTYDINITVNDTEDIDSKIISVIVLDARDLDNDGNPDFNDTDDDNDGIVDADDFLLGNVSNINSTPDLNLNLTVNGTTDLSKLFNGTFPVLIKTNLTTNNSNKTLILVEFDYTFNASNILDFGKITTNYTINGFSAVSFRGLTRPFANFTKNFTIDKVNTTVKAVCIKDADTSFESISSSCDAADETLLVCDNSTQGQYSCLDTGTRYKITGLNHSAVKELCVDNDGDGFGNGCAASDDICDNNPSQHTSSGCNPPSDNNGGSGGGSSGGGGGGGGGGSLADSSGSEKIHFYTEISTGDEVNINVNRDTIAFARTKFTVNKDLTGVTVTIRSVEEDDASNTISNAYQYIEVETDGITNDDIRNVVIEFSVNNSWFANKNFDKETVVLNRYDDGWQDLKTQKLSEGSNSTRYEAISPGFSLFAITTKELSEKIEKKTTEDSSIFSAQSNSTSQITGAVTADAEATISIGIVITIVVIILGILAYLLVFSIRDKEIKQP